MGFILILCIEGLLMLAIYTAFKKWQVRRKALKELNAFLKQKEQERKAAVAEIERLNRVLKAQIYELKEKNYD